MTLRGQIANAQGDPDGAIGDFISAIELDAAAPTAYLERGKIYEERGKIEAALADYTAAAEADPHDPAAWYRRGLLYLSMDEMVLAVEDLWSAHIRSPQVVEYSRVLINSLLAQPQLLRKWSPNLQVAIASDPMHAENYLIRAMRHLDNNKQLEAMSDLNIVIELAPQSVQGHVMRGDIFYETESLFQALDDLTTAVELSEAAHGDIGLAVYPALFEVYRDLVLEQEATQALETYLALVPTCVCQTKSGSPALYLKDD